MATSKCPLCESPCMIKVIATEDERWCEVDVCKMCGTMYPRGGKAAGSSAKKQRAKPAKKKVTRK